jgi:hypothetical protein
MQTHTGRMLHQKTGHAPVTHRCIDMKRFMIPILFILIIGAALFFQNILDTFRNMTAIEAMKFIWTTILHLTVTTICFWFLYTMPEIVKPWLRTFRKQQKHNWKSGPNANFQIAKSPVYNFKMPKEKTNPIVIMQAPSQADDSNNIRLNF